MQIILASASKRRQDLLKMINLDYKVIVSDEEEVIDKSLTVLENCQNISYQKALNVLKKIKEDSIIISCDTVVCKDNELIGKPKDKLDATLMLKKISGTSHIVYSCLTVLKVKNQKIIEEYKEVGEGLVYVDNLSNEEIEDWINKGNPYNKAGGYAIQEEFGKYVTKIEGDFYSIVGLPLNKLYQILKNINND